MSAHDRHAPQSRSSNRYRRPFPDRPHSRRPHRSEEVRPPLLAARPVLFPGRRLLRLMKLPAADRTLKSGRRRRPLQWRRSWIPASVVAAKCPWASIRLNTNRNCSNPHRRPCPHWNEQTTCPPPRRFDRRIRSSSSTDPPYPRVRPATPGVARIGRPFGGPMPEMAVEAKPPKSASAVWGPDEVACRGYCGRTGDGPVEVLFGRLTIARCPPRRPRTCRSAMSSSALSPS